MCTRLLLTLVRYILITFTSNKTTSKGMEINNNVQSVKRRPVDRAYDIIISYINYYYSSRGETFYGDIRARTHESHAMNENQ